MNIKRLHFKGAITSLKSYWKQMILKYLLLGNSQRISLKQHFNIVFALSLFYNLSRKKKKENQNAILMWFLKVNVIMLLKKLTFEGEKKKINI